MLENIDVSHMKRLSNDPVEVMNLKLKNKMMFKESHYKLKSIN